MMKEGTEQVEAGLNYYEERYKERILKGLQKKASHLGYELTPSTNELENFIIKAKVIAKNFYT